MFAAFDTESKMAKNQLHFPSAIAQHGSCHGGGRTSALFPPYNNEDRLKSNALAKNKVRGRCK
jgi:hypothetical protein